MILSMRIYISHSREFDFENELYEPIRESHLDSEHDFFLPHENNKEVITKDIIKNSDLVVAEVSFPSTGQGIELGWAESFGVPVCCIYKSGTTYTNSLRAITDSIFEYSGIEELLQALEKAIKTKL
jgi:hypothetical protein